MKKTCFAMLFLLVLSQAFAEQNGWIVEFKESGTITAYNLTLDTTITGFQSQTARHGGTSTVLSALSSALAQTGIELRGMSLAARTGIESDAQTKGIQKICSTLGLTATECNSKIFAKFSILFNGIAIKISEEEATKISQLPEVQAVYPNTIIQASATQCPSCVQLEDIGIQIPLSFYTGKGVKIAFIDTGIDFSHPAFGSCSSEEFEKGNCKKITTGVDGCTRSEALKETTPGCGLGTAIMSFPRSTEQPLDLVGHGTAIAGIATAKQDPNLNNKLDEGEVWGVAPEAEIIPLRAWNCKSEESFLAGSFESDLIQALKRAIDPQDLCKDSAMECKFGNRADVINISMNSTKNGEHYGALSKAVDSAVEAGSVVVVSAGNNGLKAESSPLELWPYNPDYRVNTIPNSIGAPGNSLKAITVGAYGGSDRSKKTPGIYCGGSDFLMSGSGTGIVSWEEGVIMKPDVIAPGFSECAAKPLTASVLECGQASAIFSGESACSIPGYNSVSGTSVSAAYVSGLAALLKEKNPDWSALEIKMAIRNTAMDKKLPFSAQGFGLINAKKALSLANAPPVALLEPIGTKGNELSTSFYQIKGIAYGRDFEKYTVEVGQLKVFGTDSRGVDIKFFTWQNGVSWVLSFLSGTIGEHVFVGTPAGKLPIGQIAKAVRIAWDTAQSPWKEALNYVFRDVLGISSQLATASISLLVRFALSYETANASQDYYFPVQAFTLENDRTIQWNLVKESRTPAIGVLVEDFTPYKWLGPNEGEQFLKLTVYDRKGGKSVDFLPLNYRPSLVEKKGTGLNCQCEKTGEGAPEFVEQRNWLWAMNLRAENESKRVVDCTEKYCDAAQLYIFFAEMQAIAEKSLAEMSEKEKQFFYDSIANEKRTHEQTFLDLSRKEFIVLPAASDNNKLVFYSTEKAGWKNWLQKKYPYPTDKTGIPVIKPKESDPPSVKAGIEIQAKWMEADWKNCLEFSGEKPARSRKEFENPNCTLDRDWIEFLQAARQKALQGQPIGSTERVQESTALSVLEASVKKCFGEQYGLENIYVDYSSPCDTASAKYTEWKKGESALLKKLEILAGMKQTAMEARFTEDFYVSRGSWHAGDFAKNGGARLLSLPVFLENQEWIAEQSRNCNLASGNCYFEIAMQRFKISEEEVRNFFSFFEKHSFLQFGLSPETKLEEKEIEFVKKNSIAMNGWLWAEPLASSIEIKLVSDAISEDFKKDFKEFFASQLSDARINPENWNVILKEGNRFETGKYKLKTGFPFNIHSKDRIEIPAASHYIELSEKLSDKSNPFLFIPFDGELGLENGRQGYGARIEFPQYPEAKIYYTNQIPEIKTSQIFYEYNMEKNRVRPGKGPDNDNIARVRFAYSKAIDDIREGSVFSVSGDGKEFEMTLKHSIPVRIGFLAAPYLPAEGEPRKIAKIYYALAKNSTSEKFSLEDYGTKKGIFTFWDFQANMLGDTVSEQITDCLGVPYKTVAAKLEVPTKSIIDYWDVTGKALPSGNVVELPLLATIAFLPPDTKIVLECNSKEIFNLQAYMDSAGKPITERKWGGASYNLRRQPIELVPEQLKPLTLKEIAEGVESEKICANTKENGTDFSWNPVTLFGGIQAD
ncbi:MAG: S8 family serine peptidase [Candidatus Diapherotrites archaeon]